ncbi:hypothetical protein EFK50_07455 [Nocardioides marmoriginsengisoli]|uniref:Uncharacterized protein n=1 Tax=Nocardioides marmoriginsengisoli TaxID=661483 RepID=A0A3N0CLL1_9ACTN|nr:hypothetical protein EFK50_07455 [Nocardioides marmoriginsengisoli]
MFSATDKGGRITGLAPGQRPGTTSAVLWISAGLCFAAWGAAAFLGSSALCSGTSMPASRCSVGVDGGWLIALVGVTAFAAQWVTTDLADRARVRLGQSRAASLLWSTVLLIGGAAGGFVAVARQLGPDPAEVLRRTFDFQIGTESVFITGVVAIAALLWGLVTAARLPAGLRYARARQADIERLRRDGSRYVGRLRLGEIIYWLGSNPELHVTVDYDSPGGAREARARMRTSPDRVPADGSAVLVFTDHAGTVHLELDPSAETVFAPEDRYTATDG